MQLTQLATALLAGGLLASASVQAARPADIDRFFDRYFDHLLVDSPETATYLGVPERPGLIGYNGRLDDASLAHERKQLAFAEHTWQALHRFDPRRLGDQQQLSYAVLDYQLQRQLEGRRFRHYNYPVNQLWGVQSSLPSMLLTQQPLASERDAGFYLARLARFPQRFEQLLAGLAQREKEGVIPPAFVIDKVQDEMRAFIGVAPTQHVLYTYFDGRLAAMGGMAPGRKAQLLAQAADTIEHAVYPAYRKLGASLAALRGKSSNDAGVWKFPDGDAYYAYVLREQTTSDYTPQQIHALGLSEVARIEGEMLGILHAQGFTGDEVGKLMAALGADLRFKYPDSDEGRARILADYRAILDDISGGLGTSFNLKPAAGLEVRRIPEFKEKTAPGAYYEGPSLDGKRPGVFYANLYDVNATERWSMRTLAYHEGIPGHHFQIGIAQELKGLPMLRKTAPFTAYVEGWALYAERLAWEMGYEQDPYDNLGRLRDELFRAVRLVVDTGIHARRWTREQAIDYMQHHTGMAESDVVAEIERYIVDPGQACAYKVGMLKILDLREHARRELGERFRLADFHDAILKNGALPLTLLDQVVERYIADTKQRAG